MIHAYDQILTLVAKLKEQHLLALTDDAMGEHFETAREIYLAQEEKIADLTTALGIRTAQLKKIQEAIDPKA